MHHRVIVALVASVLVGSHGSDLIGALTGIIHLCSLLKQFEGSKVEVHTANRYAPMLHLAYMDAVELLSASHQLRNICVQASN